MRIQFSKKLDTQKFEPIMFMAELTAEDYGIQISGDPDMAQLALAFLMDQAQKGVWSAMQKAGVLHEGEFEQGVAGLMPDEKVVETVSLLRGTE